MDAPELTLHPVSTLRCHLHPGKACPSQPVWSASPRLSIRQWHPPSGNVGVQGPSLEIGTGSPVGRPGPGGVDSRGGPGINTQLLRSTFQISSPKIEEGIPVVPSWYPPGAGTQGLRRLSAPQLGEMEQEGRGLVYAEHRQEFTGRLLNQRVSKQMNDP